jgi:hypothetical protein
MPDSLPNLDLSGLNPDLPTLKAIELILDSIESLIDPGQNPTAGAYLQKLKNEIVQLKGQKGKQGSNMIPAGVSELRQAFHSHLGAFPQTTGISSHLLLFYAAECGMKSIWLRRNRLRTTDDIAEPTLLSRDGHNLDRWRKELKIPASQLPFTTQTENKKIPTFHLERGGSSLDVEKAHQAWRYGIRLKPQDEKDLVEWLKNLCNWIKENINR